MLQDQGLFPWPTVPVTESWFICQGSGQQKGSICWDLLPTQRKPRDSCSHAAGTKSSFTFSNRCLNVSKGGKIRRNRLSHLLCFEKGETGWHMVAATPKTSSASPLGQSRDHNAWLQITHPVDPSGQGWSHPHEQHRAHCGSLLREL